MARRVKRAKIDTETVNQEFKSGITVLQKIDKPNKIAKPKVDPSIIKPEEVFYLHYYFNLLVFPSMRLASVCHNFRCLASSNR